MPVSESHHSRSRSGTRVLRLLSGTPRIASRSEGPLCRVTIVTQQAARGGRRDAAEYFPHEHCSVNPFAAGGSGLGQPDPPRSQCRHPLRRSAPRHVSGKNPTLAVLPDRVSL